MLLTLLCVCSKLFTVCVRRLLSIVHDRKLTFDNKEYMINLHIIWNIIYFNHLEKQSTQKTFSIIIATNFDN